jgi:hypothetical protein
MSADIGTGTRAGPQQPGRGRKPSALGGGDKGLSACNPQTTRPAAYVAVISQNREEPGLQRPAQNARRHRSHHLIATATKPQRAAKRQMSAFGRQCLRAKTTIGSLRAGPVPSFCRALGFSAGVPSYQP